MSLSATVHQIVCDTMAWPPDGVHGQALLRECPGWDSVNQLRVLLALEAALERRIAIKRFLAAGTLDDIAALVREPGDQGVAA